MKELSLRPPTESVDMSRFAALSAAFLRVGLRLDLLPANRIQHIQGLRKIGDAEAAVMEAAKAPEAISHKGHSCM